MGLTQDVISEFVKIANNGNKKTNTEATVNGTAVTYEGRTFVRIDGSDALVPTPVTPTVSMKDGDRVQVLIKDHTATVTGNVSDPAASSATVKEQGGKISEFEIIIADKVSVDELEAERARIKDLETDNVVIKNQLTATEADIQKLTAADVTITGRLDANEASIKDLDAEKISAGIVEATYATIANLEATDAKIYNLSAVYGDFEVLTTGKFEAIQADITSLETDKLSATDAELLYANIDFANIGEAAIQKLFTDSGIIKDLVMSNGAVTGELVGVTIKGDLIEANTIIADKLVIKGDDGLYYKLNTGIYYDTAFYKVGYSSSGGVGQYVAVGEAIGYDPKGTITKHYTSDGYPIYAATNPNFLYCKKTVLVNNNVNLEEVPRDSIHGSVITASSITADKVNVTDLVAFGATIGGFKITENSIHSGVKESVDNTTRGTYMDDDGQVSIGDANNFFRFYKDEEDQYRLNISVESLVFGGTGKSVENELDSLSQDIGNNKLAAEDSASRIEQLRTLLSQVVTNENGESLMIETEESYELTSEVIDSVDGSLVDDITTSTGEAVYRGTTSDNTEIYYSIVNSVYYKVDHNPATCTFNISDLENAINSANTNITDLSGRVTSVDSIVNSIQKTVDDLSIIGGYVVIDKEMEVRDDSGEVTETVPAIILGKSDSDFKVIITNKQIAFCEGSVTPAYISGQTFVAQNIEVKKELKQGGFVWGSHDGNYGLQWVGYTCSIIYNTPDTVTFSNMIDNIEAASSYNTTITVADGYGISSMNVVMNGIDVTSTVCTDYMIGGEIAIEKVTGDIIITIITAPNILKLAGRTSTDVNVNDTTYAPVYYDSAAQAERIVASSEYIKNASISDKTITFTTGTIDTTTIVPGIEVYVPLEAGAAYRLYAKVNNSGVVTTHLVNNERSDIYISNFALLNNSIHKRTLTCTKPDAYSSYNYAMAFIGGTSNTYYEFTNITLIKIS